MSENTTKYPQLSEIENRLLDKDQRDKLAKHDDEAKHSYNRWKKRIARRLRPGEQIAASDATTDMNQPISHKLGHWYDTDDYGEESGPE